MAAHSLNPPPHSTTCPFCAIASSNPPFPPSVPPPRENAPAPAAKILDPPQTQIILSTRHVLAFLDIMPLARGHALVIPRGHYEQLGQVGVGVGRELGKWLPILSRVVIKTVMGKREEPTSEYSGHWNVIQNNGARAAQTIPHVHFQIVPRPPLDTPAPAKGGWTVFGRGQRDDLDDDEGQELAREIRSELAKEVARVREEEGVDLDIDEDVNAVGGGGMEKL